MEEIVIKVFNGKSLLSEHKYQDYDKAFMFARNKVLLGYTCLILRNIDGKSWLKYWFYPRETI